MSRKVYPSDITREQFEHIRTFLERQKRQTNRRTVDLYDIFCAILYVSKSGCQWRMLPSDFPHWRTVYGYFKEWKKRAVDMHGNLLEKSVLENALKKYSERI